MNDEPEDPAAPDAALERVAEALVEAIDELPEGLDVPTASAFVALARLFAVFPESLRIFTYQPAGETAPELVTEGVELMGRLLVVATKFTQVIGMPPVPDLAVTTGFDKLWAHLEIALRRRGLIQAAPSET